MAVFDVPKWKITMVGYRKYIQKTQEYQKDIGGVPGTTSGTPVAVFDVPKWKITMVGYRWGADRVLGMV